MNDSRQADRQILALQAAIVAYRVALATSDSASSDSLASESSDAVEFLTDKGIADLIGGVNQVADLLDLPTMAVGEVLEAAQKTELGQ